MATPRILPGIAAGILLAMRPLGAPGLAGSDHETESRKLRCSFEQVSGYRKFARTRPMVQRPWDFDLDIIEHRRLVTVLAKGAKHVVPFHWTPAGIGFSVDLGKGSERIFLDTKTNAFTADYESHDHRLRHGGTCQARSMD